MNNEELKKMRLLLRAYVSRIALYQDTVARNLGLGTNDMKCFHVLDSEGPMTPGQLAKRTGLTTGGITKILDRLEKINAITRCHETADRRMITIEVHPPGRIIFEGANIDFERMTIKLLEGYNTRELTTIRDFMQHSMDTITQLTDELA